MKHSVVLDTIFIERRCVCQCDVYKLKPIQLVQTCTYCYIVWQGTPSQFCHSCFYTDERDEFESGKKGGRHLIEKLLQKEVIFKVNSTYYYDDLRDILDTTGMRGLRDSLLKEEGARTRGFSGTSGKHTDSRGTSSPYCPLSRNEKQKFLKIILEVTSVRRLA